MEKDLYRFFWLQNPKERLGHEQVVKGGGSALLEESLIWKKNIHSCHGQAFGCIIIFFKSKVNGNPGSYPDIIGPVLPDEVIEMISNKILLYLLKVEFF